jgi:hypothetical protein
LKGNDIMTIIDNAKTARLVSALKAFGTYPMRDDSSYALPSAQRALDGRTHYVDDATLKGFKCRILRCITSHRGFYCLIQESMPHGSFTGPRERRNVLFDVFGTVVMGRDDWYKSAKSADKDYSDICAWVDSQEACDNLTATLRGNIKKEKTRHTDALRALRGV